MKAKRINFRLGDGDENKRNRSEIEETDRESTAKNEEKIFRSFCSFQKRVGPPEYRKWRRIHGLQLPLHPQQIAGWFVLFVVGSTTFFVLIPALRPVFREGLFIILGSLFGVHVVSHLAALLLDPADPELRALKVDVSVPEFDRTKHAHVIENGRCHLCNIRTSGPKTKHCSVCNKCVDRFDHHCKWLNHCIGSRNYVAFLTCVASAVLASLSVVAVSVLEIVYYHVDPASLTVFPSNRNGTTPVLFLTGSVFLGTVAVLGLLAAVTAGLLLHLCLFHCYISALGISTYEYVRNYRREGTGDGRLPSNGCRRKREVMSNRMEAGPRKTRTRGENLSYYSCSRPPETDKENDDERCCSALGSRSRSGKKKGSGGERPFKRQSTDPEFVDKIIKPFLITLNDEKNPHVTDPTDSKSTTSCYRSADGRDEVDRCGRITSPRRQDNSENPGKKFPYANLQSFCPKILLRPAIENAGNPVKMKTNQIRPVQDERIGEPEAENGNAIELNNRPDDDFFKSKVLPELNESLKRLKNPSDLKKLENVFDIVDRSTEFDFAAETDLRKTRKKTVPNSYRSPLLSPIRESGLSNPGSPRFDLVLPPTPVFQRPFSPETSMIFLSNPNSPSSSFSSENDEDDGDDIVKHSKISSAAKIRRRTENVLRTPQLPRKVYSGQGKGDQIFVLKPSSKMKSGRWIDVEIKN